jgi:hypothetical protein
MDVVLPWVTRRVERGIEEWFMTLFTPILYRKNQR